MPAARRALRVDQSATVCGARKPGRAKHRERESGTVPAVVQYLRPIPACCGHASNGTRGDPDPRSRFYVSHEERDKIEAFRAETGLSFCRAGAMRTR